MPCIPRKRFERYTIERGELEILPSRIASILYPVWSRGSPVRIPKP